MENDGLKESKLCNFSRRNLTIRFRFKFETRKKRYGRRSFIQKFRKSGK